MQCFYSMSDNFNGLVNNFIIGKYQRLVSDLKCDISYGI